MSSGFVSGGTADKPTERDDEWLKAQQEIEANRRQKEEESRQQGGKSLYEVLQNNKAAKEEAFQESTRLKNQFRNLDEDEVEFLDSVLESTRAKERAVKKETSEQLDLFRRQQEQAEKALLDEGVKGNDMKASPTGTSSDAPWALNARKRKRVKEDKGPKGVKIRKSSSATEELHKPSGGASATDLPLPQKQLNSPTSTDSKEGRISQGKTEDAKVITSTVLKEPGPAKPSIALGLGLAGYSSDDD